jgi:hypothetical protein
MSTEFQNLNTEEKKTLLEAPAIVSVLSALSADGTIEENEKAEAIRLSHLRPFTSPEILNDYYKEVEINFEKNLNQLINKLPPETDAKKEYLRDELRRLTPILTKMDKEFSMTLVDSLKSYARHVFKAHSHFLEYFVLPVFMNDIEKEIFRDY